MVYLTGYTLVVAAFWVICGVGASLIASSKNRSGCGWGVAGFLLGPIAILIVGFMAPAEAFESDAAVASDVDDPSALEQATRSVMGSAHVVEGAPSLERGATPDLAYELWLSTRSPEHLTDFVDQLSATAGLPAGSRARETLLSEYPLASGEPEFETLAAYQESLSRSRA